MADDSFPVMQRIFEFSQAVILADGLDAIDLPIISCRAPHAGAAHGLVPGSDQPLEEVATLERSLLAPKTLLARSAAPSRPERRGRKPRPRI